MDDKEIEEEYKEKQAYLKNSKYVEIQIETGDESAGEFLQYGDNTHFVPSTKKSTINANEIASNSND